MYCVVMGSIIEKSASLICQEIQSLSDISEEESQKLSELVTRFTATETLFSHDQAQESPIPSHIYIPKWFQKLKLVGQILNWNFANIMDAFRDGRLGVFSAAELSKLVKSLFSDTPLRTKHLGEINRGRPSNN